MKTLSRTLGLICRLSMSASLLLLGQHALAEGADTDFSTPVTNSATVDYDVAGTGFSESSNDETFVVDRKVNFLVEEVDGLPTPTTLGATGPANYVEYRVTNLTNGTMDFDLSVLTPQSSADDFDMTIVSVEADDGNDPFTGGSYIDDLAEDASVLVRIYATTPSSGPTDGQISELTLLATAADAGTPLVEQATWTQGSVDNVFANASGADTNGNATESADDTFELGAPVITVTKAATVFSDPFSSGTPKAIPGAVMQYVITIDNTGSDTASAVSVGDTLVSTIELEDTGGSGYSDITVDDGTNGADTCRAELTAADNGDACTWDSVGRVLTVASRNAAGDAIDVAGGTTATITFYVVIQ